MPNSMKHYTVLLIASLILGSLAPTALAAGLADQVPAAFTTVFGRSPSAAELSSWTNRVKRGEKKTYEALTGAMYYQKAQFELQAQPQTLGAKTVAPTSKDDKQSLIKVVLPLFVHLYGSNPTEAEKAWWRKRITCGEIKNYQSLVNSMQLHRAKKARKGRPTICAAATTAATVGGGIARKAIAGISTHPMGDDVRIGIYKTDGDAITVTADNKFQVREGRDTVLATVGSNDEVRVSWSGGKYHVRGSGLEFDTMNKIRLVPLAGAIMNVVSYSDPSVTYPGKNYNRFRGVIEIRKCDGCGELWAINELRVEYYLRGLGETSGNGPEEYIKALGVAARTYVLYHKIITGSRRQDADFDIGSTSMDQIYRGYEYEIITPRMSSIFNKVKGVIVTDGEADKPVTTVYFSDSDGRTRSALETWNSSRFPHLQSVKDPHHAGGKCNGHCVGMSAQGAYGFAGKDSWSFQKILKYYYKGVSLVKAY